MSQCSQIHTQKQPISPIDDSSSVHKLGGDAEADGEELFRAEDGPLGEARDSGGADGRDAEQGSEQGGDEGEARQVRGVRNPDEPTPAMIAEHNLTHMHFRAWCPVCVAAKGVSQPHFRAEDRSDRSMPAVCADYCFMSRDPKEDAKAYDEDVNDDADKTNKITILTVKDLISGCIRPHYVPYKGIASVPWIAKEVAKDMEIWGHGDCVFKSDQERSMTAVFTELVSGIPWTADHT